ncbi:Rieske 2Fe-2S domain-containing protein [Pseudomonas sp. GD03842]|uniref:aromatic ring-hydroxylating oxygenase subunit alpha n=1 Tax=Pseudomonas sp. GD03842 TaxID=2975385 RepID=UPI00244A5273|nr:Rieske 2Fe-2S domain-containing protein [Pseudomonas sp. GD03842]MDH0749780.1 Rieske 2Fe-2S domain-containing protein [Pseudomonas sp. GD03842]
MTSTKSRQIAPALVSAYWHPLCLKSQVAEDRDFIRFNVLDFEVVVFNDAGNLIAFDNRCPHRGTRFFTEDRGRQRILCPYHGWSYGAGQLRIPDAKSFTGCDIGKADLNFFKLAFCGELVFFAIEPRASLADQLGPEIYRLIAQTTPDLSGVADFNRYAFEADWSISLENALEPYHIPLVHRDTLATLKLGRGENVFYGENSIWSAPVENEKVARRLEGLSRFFAPREAFPGYISLFLYPFSMLSSTYGYSWSMQNFFPSSCDDRTWFTSQLFALRAASERYDEIVATFMASTAENNRAVFDEDHSICKRIPGDTWSWEPPRYFSSTEAKLLHFRASCAEWAQQSRLAALPGEEPV